MARRADRCHFYGTSEEFRHRLDVLKKHCEEVGRDFDTIEKSWACDLNIASNDVVLEENLRRVYLSQAVGDASQGSVSFEGWRRQSQNRYLSAKLGEAIERIQQYVQMGVTYIMIRFVDLPRDGGLKLFAEEVIEQF